MISPSKRLYYSICNLWKNLLIYYSYTVVSSAVSIKYGLPTMDCGLGIKYGLGIKWWLQTKYKTRTTDYVYKNSFRKVIPREMERGLAKTVVPAFNSFHGEGTGYAGTQGNWN